jgi:oxygen-dependent protoporphyrinogen oxidase
VTDPDRKSIAVLGGGITGLTAAHRLAAQGHRVRLFERSDRLGGSVRTEAGEGWLVESGPNSMLEGDAEASALIRELGLWGERIEANAAAAKRYLVRNGRLVPVPLSPPGMLFTPLLSLGGKLRACAEPFLRKRERAGDASLADFVRDHLGREVLDRVVQPVVSGIWSGDPELLSMRAVMPRLLEMERSHGSVVRGQIAAARAARASRAEKPPKKRIVSFRRGLQTLPWALTVRLPPNCVVLDSEVTGIRPGSRPAVRWQRGGTAHEEPFDAVASALPAPALARLALGDSGGRPLAGLADIVHPPVSSMFLGYRRSQVGHPLDGFGVLVPALEKRSVLGVLFSSTLFPGRAPEGHVALTVMAGGALQPEMARLSASGLLDAVRGDLADLLRVEGDPVFMRHAFWPGPIPQYNLGHERHVAAIDACEKAAPGLFIGGQARDGISLSACIAAGERLARRAAA